MTEIGTTEEATAPGESAPESNKPPGRWAVKLSHPQERNRRVFSTVSEQRARQFIEQRYPRGSGAYLESPDGTLEHYEHERQGEFGSDAERWAPFDLENYRPPEEAEPPGVAAWADQEG